MRAESVETAAGWLDNLACPACETRLNLAAGQILTCRKCAKSWPVTHGVPEFVSEFPYWGEIPLEQMIEVNRQAAAQSWRTALLASPDPVVRRASEMILNLDRANWFVFTDLPPKSRVLDLGAGMGTNTHALALRFGEVVAVEPVAERVRFMYERFRQERISNVRLVRSSLWDLPFPRESFDLMVMNGVLEWVAEGRRGDPRRLQMAALKNAARLLRPGGVLYLGIENRFTPGYFVGYPDPHCSLPWVTILPRPLANWYARSKGQPAGYRNYLYSSRGYRKLLRRSGFRACACYLALPSYNHPKFYLPLDRRVFSYMSGEFGVPAAGLRGILKACLAGFGLLHQLEYSFALLATK